MMKAILSIVLLNLFFLLSAAEELVLIPDANSSASSFHFPAGSFLPGRYVKSAVPFSAEVKTSVFLPSGAVNVTRTGWIPCKFFCFSERI